MVNNEQTFTGKTKTIWKELNPAWKEEFCVQVESVDQLSKCSLELVVKDDSKFGVGKRVLGNVFININSAQGGWHLCRVAKGDEVVYLEYPLQK